MCKTKKNENKTPLHNTGPKQHAHGMVAEQRKISRTRAENKTKCTWAGKVSRNGTYSKYLASITGISIEK